MLDEYYIESGWDLETGKPKIEKLDELVSFINPKGRIPRACPWVSTKVKNKESVHKKS